MDLFGLLTFPLLCLVVGGLQLHYVSIIHTFLKNAALSSFVAKASLGGATEAVHQVAKVLYPLMCNILGLKKGGTFAYRFTDVVLMAVVVAVIFAAGNMITTPAPAAPQKSKKHGKIPKKED